MDAASFRQILPEFADPDAYSDAAVGFWLTQAGLQLDPGRWDTLLDQGIVLFVAHKLLVGRQAARAAQKGAAAGGVVASKSIDKVSVAYDTGATTLESAGNWNATSYGVQFWQLARMIGTGGLQL